jgi:hypothetical protein
MYLHVGGKYYFRLQGKIAERGKIGTDIGSGTIWIGQPERTQRGQDIYIYISFAFSLLSGQRNIKILRNYNFTLFCVGVKLICSNLGSLRIEFISYF